jgi:hypothetical protein
LPTLRILPGTATHPIGQDTSKGRCNAADQVKDRVPLANLVCPLSVNNPPPPPLEEPNLHLVYHVLSKYTQLGKKPASKKPSRTLRPAISSHFFTKPMPIMTPPQRMVMTAM